MIRQEGGASRYRAVLDVCGPGTLAYAGTCTLACLACSLGDGGLADGGPITKLVSILGTMHGQLAVVCLFASIFLLGLRTAQWFIFGNLRAIEWQRFLERLLNYVMGQLLTLGAIIEPDVPELVLWGGFSILVGFLSIYAGERTPTHASRAT